MIPVYVHLFGGFNASWARRTITNFRTDKVRALLSYLAVESGRPQRRDFLADLLWSDASQDSARRNLRKALHHLRIALDECAPGISHHLLSITAQDITLNPEYLWLDTGKFDELLNGCGSHIRQPEFSCPTCMQGLEEAAALYQGEFMRGFFVKGAEGFDEWQTIQREKLGQQALRLFSLMYESYEQRREYRYAFDSAVRQVELAPFQEKGYLQMMRALAFQGRKNEALKVHENYARLLVQEKIAPPGPEIAALREKILSGNFQEAVSSPKLRLFNFPVQQTPFFQREKELCQIIEMLNQPGRRLLTLVGPGGVGKTRLAVESANRFAQMERIFRDGIYFVPLVGVAVHAHFLAALAASLQLTLSASQPARDEILSFLTGRDILLVLDDYDYLAGEDVGAAFLLEELPEVKLLVTSQTALNLHSELRLDIGGLDYETCPDSLSGEVCDAVRFFIEVGQRFRPGFAPHGKEVEAIKKSCSLLEGNLLALEIAASWLRLVEPPTIAKEIAGDLNAMTAPLHDLPVRHRSMRAVFEHAWMRLSAAEQAVLAQASVFKSGFSLHAALEICCASLSILAGLLDKSQIQRISAERFEMHRLLHQFASEKLAEYELGSGASAGEVKARFTAYYLGLVEARAADWQGVEAARTARELVADAANLQQAWEWTLELRNFEAVGRTLEGLSNFYLTAGTPAEGVRWLQKAADRLAQDREEATSPDRARVVCRLYLETARLLTFQSAFAGVLTLSQKAAGLAKELGDEALEVRAYTLSGWALEGEGQYQKALEFIEKALNYYHSIEDQRSIALVLIRIGVINWRRGLLREAEAAFYEAHDKYQQMDNLPGVANSLSGLGIVFGDQGQYEPALAAHLRALEINRRLERKAGTAICLTNIGHIYQTTGFYRQAEASYQEALALDEEIGNQARAGLTRSNLGEVYLSLGQSDLAEKNLQQALDTLKQAGTPEDYAEALLRKTDLCLRTGRHEEARLLLEQGMETAWKISAQEMIFKGEVLRARLRSLEGAQIDACSKLIELLQKSENEASKAEIHFWLWRFSGDLNHRQEALKWFSVQAEHLQKAVYRERAAELEAA